MDPLARRKLAEFIRAEGIGLIDDPQRVKALLLDACPESRMEIGLLVTAAEDEIPSRLIRSSESVFREGEIARAVADLQRSRRFDREAAEWIVRSWAWALGISDAEPDDGLATETSDSTANEGPRRTGTLPPVEQPTEQAPQPGEPAFSSSSGAPGSPSDQANTGGWPTGFVSDGPGSAAPAPMESISQPIGRKSRTRVFAIGGVAAVVVALVATIWVVSDQDSNPQESQRQLGLSVTTTSSLPETTTTTTTTTSPPETTASIVNFTIIDQLGDWQTAETIVISANGREWGRLTVNTLYPTYTLSLSAEPGIYDYDIEAYFEYLDQYGFIQKGEIGASGRIEVYQGVTYGVSIVPRDSGYEVTLREM